VRKAGSGEEELTLADQEYEIIKNTVDQFRTERRLSLLWKVKEKEEKKTAMATHYQGTKKGKIKWPRMKGARTNSEKRKDFPNFTTA